MIQPVTSQPRRIPPISERAFQSRYRHLWNVMGAAAVIVGLIFGPRLHRWSHESSWLCGVVAIALYAASVLVCPVMLMHLWRRPSLTHVILLFSVPIGAVGIGIIYMMRAVGPGLLSIALRQQYGMYTAIGLLYAVSLLWAFAVGIHRKQLGDFDIPDRP